MRAPGRGGAVSNPAAGTEPGQPASNLVVGAGAGRSPGAGAGDGWLRRLAGYCWRYPRQVLLALGGALLATAVAAAIPLIQRDIVDNAIFAHRQPIWPGATLLIIAAVLSFGGVYVRRYMGGRVSLDVQHDLRTELFGSLTRLDGARQDQLHTGQIVSRSISDLGMIQGLLGMVPMILSSAVLFVLSVTIMAFLSPLLTLIALAVAPALWVVALASRRRLFPASWDAQQQAANVAGVVDGAVTGVRVVKGFGQEDQEIQRLEEASGFLYASRVRAVRLMARFNPVLQAVPALGQVGVLALGGWLAIRHEISIGTFFAFSAYLAQMVGPVRALAGMITIGQEARASVIRVYEVIDSRPVLSEKAGAVELPAGTPDVELDDVTFGGYDVRDLTLDSLRASIGLVMEESFLFSDTVRANIAYGRPAATQEQIVAAARAAEADEFITGLPDGYDTVIGEQGLTLSGGQRQRVALARALITDPSILVLDDATSAIDARIEAQIHATLRKVMAGRTTLLIAHRRSTLQLADRIAVLDEGRLVDEGTHDELTARCPLYRLLLAGPGDDAEGIDAGELACYSDDACRRAADLAAQACSTLGRAPGVTPALWPATADGDGQGPAADNGGTPGGAGGATVSGAVTDMKDPAAPAARGMRTGYGARARGSLRGGGGGAATSMLADIPPTPELLARVAALPPATDVPNVSRSWSRAGDPHFTLRRLLKPFAVALIAGLLLDGLDALASIAMPLLVRGGIDNGVLAGAVRPIILIALAALAIVVADWAVNAVQTVVVGRNGERLLYSLRVKIFSQLQRLGLDYYEREMAGRIMTRMTTDVDALSSFLQTGLITMVNSVLSFIGVLIAMLIINLKLGLTLLTIIPVLVAATVVFRAKSSQAYREAREKVSAVNADLQENVAGLRVAQAYRREQVNSEHFVPAVHRPAVLAGAAAVPGLRRVPAGQRRAAADQEPAAHAYVHARGRVAGTCRPPPPRPDRAARRALQLPGAEAGGAGRGQPLDRAGRDGRAGRPDRRRQVDAGQAHREVLRRHLGPPGRGRGRRPRLRPGLLPAPARGGTAGAVPVRRHVARRDRLRPARRHRR